MAAGLLLVFLLSACSGEPEPSRESASPQASLPAAETPGAGASEAPRCPNEAAAVGSRQVAGGEATGDVDGDGSDDVVFVVRDDSGTAGCQTFLVAETAGGVLSLPTDEPDVSYALQAPRVNSLAQVDGSSGLEILVDLEQGASTQFLGMFRVNGGALQKVRIGGGSPYGDLFPYGGSVGHIEASNCTEGQGADMLIAIATPNATDYTIRTVLYELRGATLIPLPRPEQPPISTGSDVELSEGFDSSPFGDCPASP
jgi:hypothetical protein